MSIEYIIHLSDIHIRLQSRRDEYEHVFKNLYEKLDNYKNKNGLIVITGDIFHDKTTLSPEAIKLSLDFFEELSNRYPTILIHGNHDGLLNVESRMNNISGVLFKKSFKNLHYLKNSGIYQFNNILFGLSSLDDDILLKSEELDEYILTHNLKDVIKVGLYHGMVGTIELECLYKVKGKYSVNDFLGYDYVLLGDVHKYQYLNESKTIGYASSLISQNFSETDNNHGFLYWDLKALSSHYEIIRNDYRYKVCNLNNGSLLIDNKSFNILNEEELKDLENYIPELGQVKVLIDADNNNEMLKYLKSKFKRVRWTENYNNIIKRDNSKQVQNINIDLKELIMECVHKNHNINLESDKLNFIYNDIISKIKNKDKNYQSWDLEKLKFNNLCIYGGEQEIDLKQLPLNQVILISGNNNVGKSTLIDIICFILYNKMARSMNIGKKIAQEIININKKDGYGELAIKYGDKKYIFRREFNRNAMNKIMVKMFIYEEKDNNKILLFNSADKANEMIENIFGKFDDFIFMNIMLQFDNIPFRSMKQNERKELLNRLLDLEKYEKLEELIKPIYKKVDDEYNNINNIMKDINVKILEEDLKNNITILKNLSEKIENLNKNIILEKIDELNKKYTCVYDEKESNNKRLIENKIKRDESDLDLIKIKKQKNLQDKIKLYLSEDTKNNIYKELEFLNLEKKPKYEIKYSYDILMGKLNKIDEKDASYNTIKVDYEIIKEEYIKVDEEYKRLSKLKRQDNFKLKKQKIYEDIQNELKTRLLSDQLEYDQVNIELADLSNLIEYDKNDDLINKINIYLESKNTIEQLKEEYNNNERIHKEYENHEYNVECEKCMKNPKIIELLRLERSLNDITRKLTEINLDDTIYSRKIIYDNNNNEYNKLCIRKNDLMAMIIKLNNELTNNNLLIQDCILECGMNDLRKKLTKIVIERDKLQSKNTEFETMNDNRITIEYELKLLLKNDIIEEENNYLDIKIKELNERMKQYDKYMKACNEIMSNDIEIKELDNRLIINRAELLKYKNNENNKILNKNILNEICKLKLEYKVLESDNLELEKEKYKIENNNELIRNKVELYNEKKEEYNKKKNERDTYFYYMEILHKNGISLSIINKYLEFVEIGVNNIIDRFLNKRVKLSMDNNNIILNIVVDDENDKNCNILMLGGRETFIFDIAFKIILSKIGELPRSNFLFIDEGISVFDVNNLNGIGELFNYLNINYEYVFLISHLEQVKDMVNKIIYVKNDGICSKIEIIK